jgi:hypothetical protein
VCSFGDAVAMFLRDLLMASLSDIVVTDYTAGAVCTRSGSGHNNWRNILIYAQNQLCSSKREIAWYQHLRIGVHFRHATPGFKVCGSMGAAELCGYLGSGYSLHF